MHFLAQDLQLAEADASKASRLAIKACLDPILTPDPSYVISKAQLDDLSFDRHFPMINGVDFSIALQLAEGLALAECSKAVESESLVDRAIVLVQDLQDLALSLPDFTTSFGVRESPLTAQPYKSLNDCY
jgi:hypothetical protein